MGDLKEKMQQISELKHRIFEDAKTMCCENGDIAKAGLMVDMVKDLASVEKDCAEACYYSKIVEAMEEEEMMGRMGYNSNRYASGRYAPSGHGNMTRGFHPSGHEFGMDRMPPDMMEQVYLQDYFDDRMGYDNSGTQGRSPSNTGRGSSGSSQGGRYGYSEGDTLDDHLEMMMEKYHTAGTEQKRREVKEKIERMLNEMR